MPTYTDAIQKNEEIYARRWDAFSGADMRIVFNNQEVGTVSSLTVTITRDIVPRYVTGDANPRTFAKGRRGIAGTMTFSVFDRDPVLQDVFKGYYYTALENLWKTNEDSIMGYKVFEAAAGGEVIQRKTSEGLKDGISTIAQDEAREIHRLIGENVTVKYIDQLPPVDVTLTFANEAGSVSVAALTGVVFLSSGIGWTMGDVDTEMATTFLARDFQPLTALLSSENRKRL